MRLMRTVMVGAALIARASVAECAWTANADGTCTQQWAPRDVLRGPEAIVNAPLLPVRTAAGGAEYAWSKTEWRWWYTVVLGTAFTGASTAGGLVEGLWWIGTGTADLLTGGYFNISPERATQLSLEPELSTVVSGKPPTPTADPCGRALVAAK